MRRFIFVDDQATQSRRPGAAFAQSLTSTGIRCIPLELETSSASSHRLDFAEALADRACEAATEASGVVVSLNSLIRSDQTLVAKRQDRYGLMIIEALRRHPFLALPVYGCSFESVCSLIQCESFRILFTDFADCNHFLRLPISKSDLRHQWPAESRLQALAEVLKSRQRKRSAAETAATLRNLLSRFGHNERNDLTAVVGPVKAALRAGCHDLTARPETMKIVRSSLAQVKAEANSLYLESSVKSVVLGEIGRLESLWESAAEAIGQIRGFIRSPERPWDSTSEAALEKIAAFEEQVLELQRG